MVDSAWIYKLPILGLSFLIWARLRQYYLWRIVIIIRIDSLYISLILFGFIFHLTFLILFTLPPVHGSFFLPFSLVLLNLAFMLWFATFLREAVRFPEGNVCRLVIHVWMINWWETRFADGNIWWGAIVVSRSDLRVRQWLEPFLFSSFKEIFGH